MRKMQNFIKSKKMATELLPFQVGSWRLEAAAIEDEQVCLEEASSTVSDEIGLNLKGS